MKTNSEARPARVRRQDGRPYPVPRTVRGHAKWPRPGRRGMDHGPERHGRPQRVPKPWGYEVIFARTPRYVGKVLHIRKGRRLSLQFHRKKDESILVVEGKLRLTYGRHPRRLSTRVLKPGQTFHVAPKLIHRFHALESCSLFEVSTPELADVVRLQDDYGRAS